jgi:hypothetical protein
MKLTARGIVACVSSFFVLLSAATFAVAQTPDKALKDRVVGHWQLVAVTLGGTEPYGTKPQGSMFLDAAGHYSVIVVSGGEAKTLSYFGTYTVSDADNSMTLHIEGSSNASADGRDLKRLLSFDGDTLTTDTPPSTGARGTVKLTWKRS